MLGNDGITLYAVRQASFEQLILFVAQVRRERGGVLPNKSEQSFPLRLLARAIDELCESPVVGFVPR